MKKFEMDIAALEADMETRYKQRRHTYSPLFLTRTLVAHSYLQEQKDLEDVYIGGIMSGGMNEDNLFRICPRYFFSSGYTRENHPGYCRGSPRRQFMQQKSA